MDIVQALMGQPAPAGFPADWRAAAKAKLERDRKSYAAFRAVDQARHEQVCKERSAEAVSKWAEEVRLFGEDIAELEPEAAKSAEAARAAEGYRQSACEDARWLRAEYERLKDSTGIPPREKTDALIRADAADVTARLASAAAEAAAEESRALDKDLAEAREGLAGAERSLDRAREQAAVPPGPASISGWTIRACATFMQSDEIWGGLSRQERVRVNQALSPRDPVTDEELRAEFGQMLGQQRSVA